MLSELDGYLLLIGDLRGQVRDLIANLPAEGLNWRPLEGTIEGVEGHVTNSLAVLATHIAGAERFWIGEVVGGKPATRDRGSEFLAEASGPSGLVSLLAQTGAVTREMFSALSETDMEGMREARGQTVPVRWCILHVIDHTALHLGHMQLTYQLWARGESGPSPRWFERLNIGD